ncbi:MAG: flagellar hook-basal body protein [Oscillospiraceae bacterium]|nr:flagellar hook-basal body protein [Oscillospiraceae bacterium]
MYEAMMIAASGLQNQQRRLDTIANNVANINTVGYKNSRLDFKDALYTAGYVPALPRTPEGNQQKGHGLMVAGITRDFTAGNVIRTERQLDMAITNEGFFAVQGADGETLYTRNGSFNLSVEDNGVYIVNSDGLYLLDANGDRIEVPPHTTAIGLDENNMILFNANDEEFMVQLGVFSFRNLMGLESVGEGNYSETIASGERFIAADAKVVNGYLEASNVDLATEMTRMIRTQRAFSLASRALITADEMEGIANNIKR